MSIFFRKSADIVMDQIYTFTGWYKYSSFKISDNPVMQLIKELIIIDKASRTPIYLQITQAFIQSIHQGKFRKGLRLPGTRQIADLLKVNRMTVIAAFRELELQGWIEMLPKKGTFVKVDPALLSPKKLSDAAAVFQLPETPGFTYDEKKILPFYTPDFPPAGK